MARTSPSGPLHEAGEPARIFGFQEAATSFVPVQRQGANYDDPIRALRRDWAEGQLSEEDLLQSLARSFRLECVDLRRNRPADALQDLLDPTFCIRHQIVPHGVEQGYIVFATARPEDFLSLIPAIETAMRAEAKAAEAADTQLKDAPRQALRISVRPVIAGRDAIHSYLAWHHGDRLIRTMTSRVPPHESCRTWSVDRRRYLITGVFITALIGLTALAPGALILGLVCWGVLTLLCVLVMKSSALIAGLIDRRPPEPDCPPPGTRLPVISVLAPMYRERGIADALIRRLERLDYPRENLDVVLVLEEKDLVTQEVVATQGIPNWMRVVIVPDGLPRTKPRAMNYALDFCRGEIIGIYDAEDAPDPDQLRRVAARFNAAPAEVACLQGALDYYNPHQNWLARCFTIEYNSWFRVVLPGLTRLGFAIPLGGTTVFMRRAPLERLGGWDAHNVTEDADLGYRLARHGYRTEILQSTTGEEANCHALPWVKQRSRWLKGYMVTYLVHMRQPLLSMRQMGAWQFFGFQIHFISAISQFLLAPLLWSLWLLMLGLPHPLAGLVPYWMLKMFTTFFVIAELQNIILGIVAVSRSQHRRLWFWVPSLHFYYPLGCLACYKALYEMIVCPFYWDKTQHGHSTQLFKRRSAMAGTPEVPCTQVPPCHEPASAKGPPVAAGPDLAAPGQTLH
ncbi:glycosyltransferase family 2 protein [Pseudooceanicola algae]|uniref:Type II secretion system protein GspE N-terminal domain-containing protein n=1 Tax=Pseudooceanicola algae TaxID=1537215 RepID=A0A7T1FN57_9RHOB|nr:glycosyltransferase [Pseudooceanicola algae]QPM89072.1 hypothetical protein PSAL_002810 [Pseudooceanicola algae]